MLTPQQAASLLGDSARDVTMSARARGCVVDGWRHRLPCIHVPVVRAPCCAEVGPGTALRVMHEDESAHRAGERRNGPCVVRDAWPRMHGLQERSALLCADREGTMMEISLLFLRAAPLDVHRAWDM